ncbi:MAG TPA: SMP-30/gluconolactonase/LRE family protein [Rhizomicrobium sp.]|nr:SMP-30/gluconolactonase/LRE family protein [Rhizomicrobium sp.]
MKTWKRIALTTSAVVVVGAVAIVARALIMGGMFTDVTPGFGGACRTIGGVVGAEDLQIDRRDGLVFISASDRRADPPSKMDGIYTLKLGDPSAKPVRLAGTPTEFHPHGISLFRAADGSLTLMAVNHVKGLGGDRPSINVFAVTVKSGAPALSEIGDIQSDKLISPNDIVAVGQAQFYVTNDHGSRTPFGMMLENYLMLPRADVLYFDGNVFKEVANNLVFANGINIAPDGSRIYVAETTAHRIQTFTRDPFSGRLTQEATLTLPSGPDNIDVDEKGDLWVADHPKLFDVLAYRDDPSKPSPSEIFRLPVKNGVPRAAQRIYSNLGQEIGAASVGAVADGHLFIGSIFDPKILDCTLP